MMEHEITPAIPEGAARCRQVTLSGKAEADGGIFQRNEIIDSNEKPSHYTLLDAQFS